MSEERALFSLPAIGTLDLDTPRCSGAMSRAGPPKPTGRSDDGVIKDTLNRTR